MKNLIDYLYQFERRLVSPIYGIECDCGFACMDKVAIAEDLGFESEDSGIVVNVVPHSFDTLADVEAFPWNISLNGTHAKAELAHVSKWFANDPKLHGGGCFGPLTVTACILGVENCCRMVRKKPTVIHAILRRVTDFMILLAREEARCGADCFWIAEPVAALLSPAACHRFCTPYLKEIYDASGVPGVLHVCGDTTPHMQALFDTGAQMISLDYCTDLPAYLAQAPADMIIMGNINPMLLWKGTLEDVRQEVESLLVQTRHYKNFIMSSGCQVPWSAPRENVQLMVDLTKSFPTWTNDEFRLITRLWNVLCDEGQDAFNAVCQAEQVPSPIAEAAKVIAVQRLAYRH